jgi:hypothetical protein
VVCSGTALASQHKYKAFVSGSDKEMPCFFMKLLDIGVQYLTTHFKVVNILAINSLSILQPYLTADKV